MRLIRPSILYSRRFRLNSVPLCFCRLTHGLAESNEIEEQTLRFYGRKKYYPVRIGESFNNRYRIIAKLGYGAYSTVWLAWDERASEYTSLKVSVRVDDAETSPVLNEVNMLRRLTDFEKKEYVEQSYIHPGLPNVRLAKEIFEVESQFGRHYCTAFKAQGSSLCRLQILFPDERMPRSITKSIIHHLMLGVNWLHSTCGVAHVDLSSQNVLMGLTDNLTLEDVEARALLTDNTPIVTDDGSVVYQSFPTKPHFSNDPVLSDYGEMQVLQKGGNRGWCMPDTHRAPEVLLDLPWGAPIDMWSIGIMTLELLEGENLFDPVDRINRQYVVPIALAQYIAYLGPPPLKMIQQSPFFTQNFDADGNFIAPVEIPETSLEEFVTSIPPGEEKDQFLRFIRKLLTWDPETRATTQDLVNKDDWLSSDIE